MDKKEIRKIQQEAIKLVVNYKSLEEFFKTKQLDEDSIKEVINYVDPLAGHRLINIAMMVMGILNGFKEDQYCPIANEDKKKDLLNSYNNLQFLIARIKDNSLIDYVDAINVDTINSEDNPLIDSINAISSLLEMLPRFENVDSKTPFQKNAEILLSDIILKYINNTKQNIDKQRLSEIFTRSGYPFLTYRLENSDLRWKREFLESSGYNDFILKEANPDYKPFLFSEGELPGMDAKLRKWL